MRYLTSIKLNILGILGILFILISAYFLEFYYHELPCPLCLLQRWGFAATIFGFLLNIKYGNRMQHYGLSLIAALFTAAVAMRQILLHIVQNSGSYGSPFLGFHLYTWSFIISVLLMIFIAFDLILEPEYGMRESPKWVKRTIIALLAAAIALTFANAITTFFICGIGECPENPTTCGVSECPESPVK